MATIRPVTDADADSVIAVIDSCYREYDGCVLLVDEEEPELKSPASSFAAIGGSFWVAEDDAELTLFQDERIAGQRRPPPTVRAAEHVQALAKSSAVGEGDEGERVGLGGPW